MHVLPAPSLHAANPWLADISEAAGTVRGVPQLSTMNAELNQELDRYAAVPEVADGIRSVLGLAPGEPVGVEHCSVLAYALLPSDELFRSFFLTPRALCVFEMMANGDSLSVTIPLTRITRVAETRAVGAVIVTIEIDADVRRVTGETSWIESDAPDGEIVEPNGRRGRSVTTNVEVAAFYEMAESAETGGAAIVTDFTRRLRTLLEQ